MKAFELGSRLLVLLNMTVLLGCGVFLLFAEASPVHGRISQILSNRATAKSVRAVWPTISSTGNVFSENTLRGTADTIVIFSDYYCPYCRELHVQLLRHEATKPLPVIRFRHFPVGQREPANTAASIAYCASAQRQFRQVHDYLMESEAWQLPGQELDSVVMHVPNLDALSLSKCVASLEAQHALKRDSALAAQLHINATPTIVYRNRLIVGLPSREVLDGMLE